MVELAGIIILGILAQWFAWKLKIPAILPLILIGLLAGPISSMYTENGMKLLEPVWNGQKGLFPGEGLYYFVSLAISIILFEGGLTLKREEIKNVAPEIIKLITLGSVITFFCAGIAAHYIFYLDWEISFLFSSLVIVTGPTVITPILRNIPLKKDVSTVLKWEGILIDPIGALVAVLVFEFISAGGGSGFTETAFIEFGKILLFGVTFGFTFAHALAFAINKNFIPHYLLNVVSLSAVLMVFVVSDIFAHESGLLAVVIMGMVMGNGKLSNIKELLYFKESLSVLLISILFILLAANISIKDLMLLYNWNSVVLFVSIVFLIRPLAVFLSTTNSDLKYNEKLFISWVGPRGIVAAGIASLFGEKLMLEGIEGAEYIMPLVFMVVLGTVLLNATTARPFAKMVSVYLEKSDGIVIIGASKFARLIGHYLENHGRHVVLIDSSESNIAKARDLGLEAINASIYSEELTDNIELSDVGYLIAMTASSDINTTAIQRFEKQFGENGTFRLLTTEEKNNPEKMPQDGLFSQTDDFVSLTEAVRDYPAIHEVELKNKQHYQTLLRKTYSDKDIIPLFVKDLKGELEIISTNNENIDGLTKGWKLVYMGKPLDIENAIPQ